MLNHPRDIDKKKQEAYTDIYWHEEIRFGKCIHNQNTLNDIKVRLVSYKCHWLVRRVLYQLN